MYLVNLRRARSLITFLCKHLAPDAEASLSSFFSVSSPLACKRCGWMPITLLSDRSSPGFRASYIHVEWGAQHQLFTSKHTNKHCLFVCVHRLLVYICKCTPDQTSWPCSATVHQPDGFKFPIYIHIFPSNLTALSLAIQSSLEVFRKHEMLG